MLQEENKQNVGNIQFIDENKQQEEDTKKAWKSYQFLVWLPVVFAMLSLKADLLFFTHPLYLFLAPTLLLISVYEKISKSTAIMLKRFGLSFFLGWVLMWIVAIVFMQAPFRD